MKAGILDFDCFVGPGVWADVPKPWAGKDAGTVRETREGAAVTSGDRDKAAGVVLIFVEPSGLRRRQEAMHP